MTTPHYRRVVLKLSGEALGGDPAQGLDGRALTRLSKEISSLVEHRIQVGVVVGGGNFFRGARLNNLNMNRVKADYVGMLATVMNGIALQQALVHAGISARVQSGIHMPSVTEPYVHERAIKHLSQHRVVVFAGGTGNPFFTTDTAASLRAIEVEADILLKATQVDGIYDRDPALDTNAKRYEKISYDEVLEQRLGVMDATAIALCREHNLPLLVFDISKPGCLLRVVMGDNSEGTLVYGEVGK